MPQIPLIASGSLGVIKDIADHLAPPEAWTNASNVRFVDGKAIKTPGYASVLGAATVPPTFLMPVEYSGDAYWLYPEVKGAAGKIYVIKGSTHFDISKVGGYASSLLNEWSGSIFQGTPILNSPNNVPQYWGTISTGTLLADFPNWISGDRCKFMATYKNYIIMLNTSNGGSSFPHRVKWSDGAAPGTMPASWDVTDAVHEAGQLDLSDVNAGEIICGGQLGAVFPIYKKDTTWLMRYIGGSLIMAIDPVLLASGILGPRTFCQVTLPKQNKDVHFLCNGYDIGVFDGAGFMSVVHMKLLRYVMSILDTKNFGNAFCFNDTTKEEAIFAFPTIGQTYPNLALVWNYRDDTCTLRDWLGLYAAVGAVDTSDPTTWNSQSLTWNQMGIHSWNSSDRRRTLVADPLHSLFYNLDNGVTANGATFASSLERTGLAVIGTTRTNQPMVDFENIKIFHRLWPKVRGGRVNISLGAAEKIGDLPVYNPPQLFDPADGFDFIDAGGDGPPVGRLLAIKFEGVGDDQWVLEGYTVEVELVGQH